MLKKLYRKVHRRFIVLLENILARLDSNFADQNRKKKMGN